MIPLPTLGFGESPPSDSPGLECSKVQSPPTDEKGLVVFANSITDQPHGPLLLREAAARYLTLRITEGVRENTDTYRHMSKHLARLCALLGDMTLKAVKADHLRTWMAGLKSERHGRKLDDLTKRHHMITIKTFFKRAWREGWVERDPTLPIVLPQIEEKDVNVISAADAFRFFKRNADHRAVARIALEAFGGIRNSTAGKLQKENIKFDRRGIEMPSRKHKSTKRKFRQGHPSNLWDWLGAAPDDCWSLLPRQYTEEKKEMHVIAGLRPLVSKTDADRQQVKALKNVWRHSFVSYYLAIAKDYAPIAYLSQHAKATTTEIYEGIADEFDALCYFSITRDTVKMDWEEFRVLVRGTKHLSIPQPVKFPL